MNILVVDDEPAIRFSLAELLESDGHAVRQAEHAPAAMALLEEEGADLVLSDLSMPAMDGMALLEEVRARHPASLFVLMTAHGDERTAVRALRPSRSKTTKSACWRAGPARSWRCGPRTRGCATSSRPTSAG
jgi:DNA-binding NtrC family response regulator